MRWAQLQSSTGAVYVDLAAIDAVGPAITETLGGRTLTMRALYLRGGQLIEILDSPENLAIVFETKGTMQ